MTSSTEDTEGARGKSIRAVPWLPILALLAGIAPWALLLHASHGDPFRGANAAPPEANAGVAPPVAPTSFAGPSASAPAPRAELEPRSGRTERIEVSLEPPVGDISADLCTAMPRWRVGSRAAVERVAATAGLDAASRRALFDGVRCDARQCEVAPGLELLGRLARPQRAALYEDALSSPEDAEFPVFRRRAVDTERWTRNAGLLPATRAALDELSFQRGDLVFLADLALLCSRLPSAAERARLVAALDRTPALVVTLHVDARSDLDALTRYWGAGSRGPEVRALLQALARMPDGGSIDVAHLVPAFARERLYTFPRSGAPARDCHWTSMNFWSDKPDDRFLDENRVRATVASEYVAVDTHAPELGDVLLFVGPEGKVVHSAVHVVEDVVFTKNGHGALSPWVLSTRSEVLAAYFRATHIRVFRRRSAT